MKIPLLILLLGLNSNTQAQFRDLYQPLQNDSIYKNNFVKSRLVKYYRTTIKSNTFEIFNEKGQIVKTIIYNIRNVETPQYQTEFFYDSAGKLISSISKDLSGNNGYLINPYSKTSNEVASKYEYNSTGKLIRKIDIGLNRVILEKQFMTRIHIQKLQEILTTKSNMC